MVENMNGKYHQHHEVSSLILINSGGVELHASVGGTDENNQARNGQEH